MKQILVVILFLFSSTLVAQNFEDEWKAFFSYISVKDISQGNNRIYAGAENTVFIYDLITQEISTLSTVNGLSGELISSVYYSENFGLLVIGYENGLIDVVIDGDEDILRVVDILDKPTISPDRKGINNFEEFDGTLYISTQFGISLFDLGALEFGDTYFIGDLGSQINIVQTTIQEPYIYAASTEGGVRRALVEGDNLIDFEQWNTILLGDVRGIQALGNELYGLRAFNAVQRWNENLGIFQTVQNFQEEVVDFETVDNKLTVSTLNTIQTFSEGYIQEATVNGLPDFEYILQSGMAFGNNLFLGTETNGMLVVPFGTTQALQVLPDGPILNQPFALDSTPGQLWVVFGDISQTFNPFPLSFRGISNLRQDPDDEDIETWTNITEDEIFGASDLVKVTINPNNPDEVYMSSYQKGLLKVEGQVPVTLFNQNNSPLSVPPDNPNAEIRLFGSDFDRDGNLWFVQSRVNDGLIRLSPSGQFQKIDFSVVLEGTDELALSNLAISREGFVFFGTAESGLVGYDPATNRFNKIAEASGNGNLSDPNVRALAFDASNRLWIGTVEGLRVLFNVGGFFEEGVEVEAQEIIILEDGVPQELLFGQSITDIVVDGSNNKWISTSTAGVFYLSSNGQETLLRFTKDNSPLPSNDVQEIAIDERSGRVYFACRNGLVAFNGSSTAPRDDLSEVYSFPNPVRPGFTGNVTIDGLTADANVKITDITGNLVHEATSEGGSILWDTTAFGQYKVASGVYLALITTDDAIETKVHKIMIVR